MGNKPLVLSSKRNQQVNLNPTRESRSQNYPISEDYSLPEDGRRYYRPHINTNSLYSTFNIMRKWNLSFSGARGEDPDTFLTRISQGIAMVPVRDDDILRILPFFLKGIAARWFDGHQDQLETFYQFSRACRDRFSNPDFQFELSQEIHRRTQGEYESVADYLTCMLSLFDRVSPRFTESDESAMHTATCCHTERILVQLQLL